MSTTNPRIKLFNGKAGIIFRGRERKRERRWSRAFPIHFARPSGRQERDVIYIGGGCHPTLFFPLADTGDITPAGCARESL